MAFFARKPTQDAPGPIESFRDQLIPANENLERAKTDLAEADFAVETGEHGAEARQNEARGRVATAEGKVRSLTNAMLIAVANEERAKKEAERRDLEERSQKAEALLKRRQQAAVTITTSIAKLGAAYADFVEAGEEAAKIAPASVLIGGAMVREREYVVALGRALAYAGLPFGSAGPFVPEDQRQTFLQEIEAGNAHALKQWKQ